jgi:hypothetical protein
MVPTMADYTARPVAERLDRLGRTPAEIAAAIGNALDDALGRRPARSSWSPTEIVCHLRDVEELFQVRFHTMLAMDEPKILVLGAEPAQLLPWGIGGPVGNPLDPDRWAEERQYHRQEARPALAAFARHRAEVVALLTGLSPAQWQRGGIHPARGRLALGDWVASLAAHDDNHLGQLRRAIEGRP